MICLFSWWFSIARLSFGGSSQGLPCRLDTAVGHPFHSTWVLSSQPEFCFGDWTYWTILYGLKQLEHVWVEATSPEIATEGMPSNRSWGSTCCGWDADWCTCAPNIFKWISWFFFQTGITDISALAYPWRRGRSPRDAAVLSQKMVAAEEVEMQYTWPKSDLSRSSKGWFTP